MNRGARLTELLKQAQYSPMPVEEQVVSIYAGVNGYLDNIPVTSVTNFEQGLLTEVRTKHDNILSEIGQTGQLSAETASSLKEVLDTYAKNFAAD